MSQQRLDSDDQKIMTDRLRKVLLLEKEKKFTDDAVIGGMDGFVKQWALEAHRNVVHPMFRSTLRRLELVSPDYASKSPRQRADWLERVLRWADGFAGVSQEGDQPPPSRRQPAKRASSRPAKRAADAATVLRAGQSLDTPLGEANGFTPFVIGKLERLGVSTVRELLYLFPRRHIDFTRVSPIASLEVGREQTAMGTVWEASEVKMGASRRRSTEAVVGDDSGNVRVVWFNQPWVARALRPGTRIALSGRVALHRGHRVFENPEYEPMAEKELVHTARLVPVYPLTEGLTSRRLRTLIKKTVDACVGKVADFLPEEHRRRRSLAALPQMIGQAHFPDSLESKERARRRLAFDELLLIQLGVLHRKREWKQSMPGHPLQADPAVLDAFFAALPFEPTGAQRRCVQEVMADLGRSTPMSRLLQGEVGSGKTVVALAAALVAAANGQQTAFMAPTEILAEQHFRTVQQLLKVVAKPGQTQGIVTVTLSPESRPVTVAVLTGGLSRKRKQEVQELANRGEIDIVVGTHALFQKDMEFASLGLVIVDEQHRFGVMQRSELRQKGYNPHLLVMTATPIPRTLYLTLYGDLDISVIDELPAGRREIRTRWLDADRRDSAYAFIRKQVGEGRQAFIVYPLIEESERLQQAAARQEHRRLSEEVFPDLRVGLLHGRMKASEKDKVMRRFGAGELDVLVATAVVEVGIDVPNATVMLVESAERFGLAQLHQFRGRVGRSEHESYCMLISDSPTPGASERLRLMETIHDGFQLAEEDLRLRGPGEFFGTRQSGMPDLRMARISDLPLLEEAREVAGDIFEADPTLERPEHRELAAAVERAWRHRTLAPGEA